MFCPNCGSELPEGAKFCTNCGSKIAAAEQPTVVVKTEEKKAETPVYVTVNNTYDQEKAKPAQPATNVKSRLAKKGCSLSILGFVFAFFPGLNYLTLGIFAPLGIIFSAIGKAAPDAPSKSKAGKGLAFGIIGFVLAVLTAYLYYLLFLLITGAAVAGFSGFDWEGFINSLQ